MHTRAPTELSCLHPELSGLARLSRNSARRNRRSRVVRIAPRRALHGAGPDGLGALGFSFRSILKPLEKVTKIAAPAVIGFFTGGGPIGAAAGIAAQIGQRQQEKAQEKAQAEAQAQADAQAAAYAEQQRQAEAYAASAAKSSSAPTGAGSSLNLDQLVQKLKDNWQITVPAGLVFFMLLTRR